MTESKCAKTDCVFCSPITNADHIRSLLNNEELCKFLYFAPNPSDWTKKDFMAWLESEYEGEGQHD